MESIKELIEEGYYQFVSEKGIEPSIIIIHPATFEKLILEFGSIYKNNNIEVITYRDLRVIRSFDINEDEVLAK